MGTAFLPEFHEGSADGAGQHAAGHVAGEVRRDRPARRADPAGAARGRRHGAAHRPRRARRARAGRRGGGDRRRPARDRPAARRAAGRAAARLLDAARHQRDHRPADLAPHRPHAVGHARQHRGQGVRRRSADAAPAGRARARRRWPASRASSTCRSSSRWTCRSSASCSIARRSPATACAPTMSAEAVETSFAGATVGRIFDRGTGVRSGREVRPGVAGRLRAARRPADRHAERRHGADPAAGRRAARGGPEHDPARERPAPDRDLVQRRRARSGQRGRRHRAAVARDGADARRLPRRVRRPVRERAERVAAAAGPGRRRGRRAVHAAGAGVRPAARRLCWSCSTCRSR